MPRYLDPTNDFAFRRVFCDKNRLISFLNAIMKLPKGNHIVDLRYIPQEQIPELIHCKSSLIDIKCQDEVGNVFIVEMQNGYEQHLLKSLQFYSSSAYTAQLRSGSRYGALDPVFVIVLLRDQVIDPNIPIISYHKSTEVSSGKHIFTDITHVIVELEKFSKSEDALSSEEDYWLYFLSQWSVTQDPPKTLKEPAILEAYHQLEEFRLSEGEYKAYLDAKTLFEKEVANLEIHYNDGFKKGEEKGIEKGAEQRNIEIAQSMLADGESVEKIQKWTGLSLEQINSLQ